MTPAEALAWFDGLAPVTVADMTGRWRGEAVPTGHRLDPLLAAAGWWGKAFEGPEDVHPLLHGAEGRVAVNPALLPLSWGVHLPPALVRFAFPLIRPLIATRRPRARLRMMGYRGVTSATMIYDAKPICDVFRRIDDATVLGCMDQRGADPFFFKLTRDGAD
ncbi:DUF4334 domain-containing protein [Yoonia sp. R2331]|uniref:DUF4334 domain-containing protein n=1 Tax=Yoonia sp. R2331 TaxID=3237238 RepID=UPI0034E59788